MKFSPRGAWKRLLIGMLLPAPLGTLIVIPLMGVANGLSEERQLAEAGHESLQMGYGSIFLVSFLNIFPLIIPGLIIAFAMIGIQSVIYSVAMEFAVNRYCANNILAVLVSIALGVAAASPFIDRSVSGLQVAVVAAVVGLVSGLTLRRMYRRMANQAL